MKRFGRCICLFLVAVMVLSSSVFALETGESRSSSFFVRSSVYLHKTGTTTFQAWFEVTGMRRMEELGASSITIQRSSDGVNWESMRKVTKSTNDTLVGEDALIWDGYISYTGMTGYYYRAKVVLYAKDSTGIGEVTEYTSSLKL